MHAVDITAKLTLLFGSGLWLWIFVTYEWRRRRLRNEDVAWTHLQDHLDMMHAMFGNSITWSAVTKHDGTREIQLACRKCGKKNRLVKGFKNSKCGSCHTALVVQPGEVSTPKPAADVRFN